MLNTPIPPKNDPEGSAVPLGLPPVVDAHVHVFPDGIFQAIWKWFDKYAWPIRYQMTSPEIIDFLLSRGVQHVVALQYAHKPGMARGLNDYMAELMAQFPGRLTGMATVLPGEPDAETIVADGFAAGLGGVKLHIHVQCFTMADESLHPIFQRCQDAGKPMIVHAGREPRSPAYACDPYEMLAAIPAPDPTRRGKLEVLSGDVPSPVHPPSGCRFRTRCPIAVDHFAKEEPPLRPVSGTEGERIWWRVIGRRRRQWGVGCGGRKSGAVKWADLLSGKERSGNLALFHGLPFRPA